MMNYRYKAMDRDGRIHRGELLALHPQALETALSERGLDLIRFRRSVRDRTLFPKRVGRRTLIQFCFQLEQLLSAGVPILQALRELHDVEETPRLRAILATLATRVEAGQTLSEAMEEESVVFDSVFTNLVRVGEQSGRISEALRDLGGVLTWREEIYDRASRVMLYPAFLGLFILGVCLFLFLYLVPQLVSFIAAMNATLPFHTRLLLAVSAFAVDHWPLLIGVPITATVAATVAFRHSSKMRHFVHGSLFRLPFLGDILKKLALARFCRTFALLYNVGVPVLDIVRISRDVGGNVVLAEAIEETGNQIANGASLHQAFERARIFPPLVLRMVAVGETTGGLDRTFLRVSELYDRDARDRLGRAEVLLEPALTLVLGVLLGWIMLSILGPLYDVIAQVRL